MSILFEPIELNGMKVPNRVVRSATNDRRAEVSGKLTDGLIDVYEALAAGGVGLIITGHAYVTWNGKASPEMIGVHNDDMNPGLKRLVDSVHKYDSKIVIQLNHAGRQTKSATIGETPVAPSAVYNSITEETPRELSVDEIETLILSMKFDDGFVAYLNGIEVESENAPGRDGDTKTLTWNSSSTASHPDSQAVTFIEYDISSFKQHLRTGTNILAIHGLNWSSGSGRGTGGIALPRLPSA